MIEIPDAVKVPELAEIVEVDELTPVVEVVKESVEEVSSESRCLNCDAEMTFDHQCDDMNSDSDWEDVLLIVTRKIFTRQLIWTVKIGLTSSQPVSTDFMAQSNEPIICDLSRADNRKVCVQDDGVSSC